VARSAEARLKSFSTFAAFSAASSSALRSDGFPAPLATGALCAFATAGTTISDAARVIPVKHFMVLYLRVRFRFSASSLIRPLISGVFEQAGRIRPRPMAADRMSAAVETRQQHTP